jgi:hypothetical protein
MSTSERAHGGKELVQIDAKLFRQVFADRPNGNMVYAGLDEGTKTADAMIERPASVPDFHAFA